MGANMTVNERLAKVENQLEENNKTTWRVFEALYGNGKPGLLSEFRILRQSVEDASHVGCRAPETGAVRLEVDHYNTGGGLCRRSGNYQIKQRKEKKMDRTEIFGIWDKIRTGIVIGAVAALVALAAGCSHNVGGFTIGTRTQAGIDPQSMSANISHTDGLNVIDVSRENLEWEIEINDETGVTVDRKTGNIKGIKRIRRKVGPQVTGYLVDLVKVSPEFAKWYLEYLGGKQTAGKTE